MKKGRHCTVSFPLSLSLRLGVPSLPAGEHCGDLREKEGFLMVESPSWTAHRQERCKLPGKRFNPDQKRTPNIS